MPGTNPGCLLSSAHLVHSWQMRDGLVSSSTGFRCFSSVKFCGHLRPKVLMAASGPCRTQVFSGVSRFFLMPWGSTNRNKHGARWCNMVNTMTEGSRDFLYLVCRYIRTRPACLFQRMTGGLNGEVRQFLDDRPEFFHAMVTAMFEQAGPKLHGTKCQRHHMTSNCWVKFQGWSCYEKPRFVAWILNFQRRSLMPCSRLAVACCS